MRHAGELAELLCRERGAHEAYRIAHARLVQGDRVGIALADDHLAGARGMRAREVRPIEVQTLVVDLVVGRVQVLRRPPVRRLIAHGPRAESEHAPAQVGEREADARPEAVVGLASLARALRKPGGIELLDGEASPARRGEYAVPRAWRIADLKLAQHLLPQPAPSQVVARAVSLARLPQVALVVGGRAREQLQEALAAHAPLRRLRVLLLEL